MTIRQRHKKNLSSTEAPLKGGRKKFISRYEDCLSEVWPVEAPFNKNDSQINLILIWSRLLACFTSMHLCMAGINYLTGTMIVLVAAMGLTTCEKSQHHYILSRHLLIQFAFLSVVLIAKTSARVAGIDLNEMAFKFIFVSSAEQSQAFGDFFNFRYILKGVCKVLSQATMYTLLIGIVPFLASRSVSKTFGRKISSSLKWILVCAILISIGQMGKLRFDTYLREKNGCLHSTFVKPPPISMKKKPSIIIISLDSLRNDLFGQETFPLTLGALLEDVKSLVPKQHTCTRWNKHDSGAFQSDQGFATLYYSMLAPQSHHFVQHKHDENIKSWPLEALRSQEYHLHRITPYNFKFCWVISAECDIHFRDFDTTDPSINQEVDGGDARVYDAAAKWIHDQTANKLSPYLLSIDLQETRFPYRATGDLVNKFLPELSEEETYLLKQNLQIMSRTEIKKSREKLVNRIKNSLRKVDHALSNFIETTINPLLASDEDVIVIITADHGEILMDGLSTNLGHGINSADDNQRMVPLFMCGATDLISDLHVPTNMTTSHADVLPSILEASGAIMGSTWEREVGFRSFSRFQQAQELGGKSGIAISHHPWQNLVIASSGSNRIVTRDSRIIESSAGVDIDSNRMVELKSILQDEQNFEWPGLQINGCDIDDLDTEEIHIPHTQQHPMDSSLSTSDSNLERLKASRPSIDVVWEQHQHGNFTSVMTFDIMSIGSDTRFEYLKAQVSTWASHLSVRSFWGFTERQDHNETCMTMSQQEVKSHLDTCRNFKGWRSPIKEFIGDGYAYVENMVREESGWLCAQRRIGRALGWIKNVPYAEQGNNTLPDFLLIVDDDTFIDLESFQEKHSDSMNHSIERAQVVASCLFETNGFIKWPFAYGGFGTYLNRASIQQLIHPIYCKGGTIRGTDVSTQGVCDSIRRNRLGERKLFREGMSIADLFHDYSALQMFCVHSDWLMGYITRYYLTSKAKEDINIGSEMTGIAHWPSTCGNVTMKCQPGMDACHRQPPEAMEALTSLLYSKSPEKYRLMPKVG